MLYYYNKFYFILSFDKFNFALKIFDFYPCKKSQKMIPLFLIIKMEPKNVLICPDCKAWVFDLTIEYCPFCIQDDEEKEYKLDMEAAIADCEDEYITEFIEKKPITKSTRPCRFGYSCRNPINCKFSHENQIALCKFGSRCNHPTTCKYKH